MIPLNYSFFRDSLKVTVEARTPGYRDLLFQPARVFQALCKGTSRNVFRESNLALTALFFQFLHLPLLITAIKILI